MRELGPDELQGLDEIQVYVEPPKTPCGRLIGCAGAGKTYTIAARVAANRRYGILTATTGIAAVNLGAVTINSTLKYFDTASLRDALLSGRLVRALHSLALEYDNLIIEEYSMLEADQLDILYRATTQANSYSDVKQPMGILLVGDLAQLPPVRARWCFEADCWPEFAASTERLTKVWRQDGGPFLDALNHVRAGSGLDGARELESAGVVFHSQSDTRFEGTTILPKNTMVNNYNWDVLRRQPGKPFTLSNRRWGAQRSEWGENKKTHEWGIPQTVELKIGAYVMVLSNDPDMTVVNGDCGYIVEHTPGAPETVVVRLVRTGKEVDIAPVVREVSSREKPDGWSDMEMRVPRSEDFGQWIPRRHYRSEARRYVLGQIEYWPLRLAWASTVHKSQGLTLDRCQVDFRDTFFGSPAMLYVALSRCRTLEGLRLVGDRDRFVKQCTVDSRVLPWL